MTKKELQNITEAISEQSRRDAADIEERKTNSIHLQENVLSILSDVFVCERSRSFALLCPGTVREQFLSSFGVRELEIDESYGNYCILLLLLLAV